MKGFLLTLIRLLTGRISFERKARLAAMSFVVDRGLGRDEAIWEAQGYYYFLLTGEHIACADEDAA